ncbi:MAG: hypothetical protein IH820_04280 [Bacteroidetes bacterium]|nr:hypothetical protein [Bacteroidota bacterium]
MPDSDSAMVFDPLLSADVALRIPSVKKAEQMLGFKAKVGLEEGIRRTANWMQKALLAA